MHIFALIAATLFHDRFLWPYGVPVEMKQHGDKSVSIDLDFTDLLTDIVIAFMEQWSQPFTLARPDGRIRPYRELTTRITVVDAQVDLTVRVSPDHLQFLTYKETI